MKENRLVLIKGRNNLIQLKGEVDEWLKQSRRVGTKPSYDLKVVPPAGGSNPSKGRKIVLIIE